MAQERYRQLIVGNAVGLGVSLGLSDEEILSDLPGIIGAEVHASMHANPARPPKAIARARERLRFID